MTRTIIYTRFSPRRNEEECQSCDVQEAYCEQHAHTKGYFILSRHRDEAASGGDEDRPGMWEAIEKLQKGDVLLVDNVDRLARSVRLMEILRHTVEVKGAKIEAVTGDIEGDGPEHEMMRQILSVFAEYLRKAGALRTRSSMRMHQANGQKMSRFPPYGYQFDPADKKKTIPKKSELATLNLIRQLLASGEGYNGIARILNERTPETARGTRWHAKTILKIAGRPKTKHEE